MSLIFVNSNNFKRKQQDEPPNKKPKSDNKQVIHNFQRYWWKTTNKDESSRYVCVYRDTKKCPASITIGKDKTILRTSDYHSNHPPMTEAEVQTTWLSNR